MKSNCTANGYAYKARVGAKAPCIQGIISSEYMVKVGIVPRARLLIIALVYGGNFPTTAFATRGDKIEDNAM